MGNADIEAYQKTNDYFLTDKDFLENFEDADGVFNMSFKRHEHVWSVVIISQKEGERHFYTQLHIAHELLMNERKNRIFEVIKLMVKEAIKK